MKKNFFLTWLALLILIPFLGCHKTSRQKRIVFLSDFGLKDDSVAICKGVMWSINPALPITDLTHDVTAYDIKAAGRLIAQTAPYYPEGTVFVAVVDPGVGSTRPALALRSKKGRYYVGPDNGLFSRVIQDEGLEEARHLTNEKYFYKDSTTQKTSHTFHGRDIFSPVAAHVASGINFQDLGPATTSIVLISYTAPRLQDNFIEGQIEFIEEPYGNAITNIPSPLLTQGGINTKDTLVISWDQQSLEIPLLKTFSDISEGQALALISSRGYLCLAINMGHFSKKYRLNGDTPIKIKLKNNG